MTGTLRHRLLTCAAMALIALSSVLFAAHNAPTPQEVAAAGAFVAMGGSTKDLCGSDLTLNHDHCPFCRLLSDPPNIAPTPRVFNLSPVTDTAAFDDLVRHPQGGTPRVSARAPPALA